jgi:hypothetical protein
MNDLRLYFLSTPLTSTYVCRAYVYDAYVYDYDAYLQCLCLRCLCSYAVPCAEILEHSQRTSNSIIPVPLAPASANGQETFCDQLGKRLQYILLVMGHLAKTQLPYTYGVPPRMYRSQHISPVAG